jgi:transposase
MFPRIVKTKKKGKTYQYLVLSESVRKKGKSTTRNIVNLGNIASFPENTISHLIDSLVRLFQLESHIVTDGVEVVECLEYGSIIFWQTLWDELALSDIIRQNVTEKHKHVAIGIEKYVQIMVINRCVDPLSKLGATRWVERTGYKRMKSFANLSLEVKQFYRSMDYLVRAKEDIEQAIYKRLEDLFSINVHLTFYDITSTYMYTENCLIGKKGYSRDHRPDLEQIVIGVVTSYEGYPIKHYVFEGNTKDETTVTEVVTQLRSKFNIEQTTFVGDRGMMTKLNLRRIENEGFGYIMGVKHRQDDVAQMLVSTDQPQAADSVVHRGLLIKDYRLDMKVFVGWKIAQLLTQHSIQPTAVAIEQLHEKIRQLSDKDTFSYSEWKPVLVALVNEQEKRLPYRLFQLLKKYSGAYDTPQRYVICLNEERKRQAQKQRQDKITEFTNELEKCKLTEDKKTAEIEQKLNKIFSGYGHKYRKFFDIERDAETGKATGYRLNTDVLEQEQRSDGIFILRTSQTDISATKVVDTYKDLQEVESLFDDLKHFVDINPIRHWLTRRVKAHVFLCILSAWQKTPSQTYPAQPFVQRFLLSCSIFGYFRSWQPTK